MTAADFATLTPGIRVRWGVSMEPRFYGTVTATLADPRAVHVEWQDGAGTTTIPEADADLLKVDLAGTLIDIGIHLDRKFPPRDGVPWPACIADAYSSPAGRLLWAYSILEETGHNALPENIRRELVGRLVAVVVKGQQARSAGRIDLEKLADQTVVALSPAITGQRGGWVWNREMAMRTILAALQRARETGDA